MIIENEYKYSPKKLPLTIERGSFAQSIFDVEIVFANKRNVSIYGCINDDEFCKPNAVVRNFSRDLSEIEGVKIFNNFVYVFGSNENPEDDNITVKKRRKWRSYLLL